MTYNMPRSLQNAISILFDDPSVAHGLLGVDLADQSRDTDLSGAPLLERIAHLKRALERFVVQMASEVAELGAEETPRLRAEATSMLVVLREMRSLFPEMFSSFSPE